MSLQSVVPNTPARRETCAVHPSVTPPRAAAKVASRTTHAAHLPDLLGPQIGVLASEKVDDALAGAREGPIGAQSHLALPHLAIVTGDTGAMIELDGDRPVLTGVRGTRNDCRLLLRRAYGTVRFEVHGDGGEAHLGLLSWRNGAFEEMQTIDIQRRLARGYRDDNGGRLSTLVEFRAEPLREVHGVVWRGGLLRISRLSLQP